MIRNLSYNDKKIEEEVNETVGKGYSLIDKLKMNGNGSQRFFIKNASDAIQTFLDKDNNLNHCNIELRPNGIIIRFRSVLETMGWIIPYHLLTIYQNSGEVSIYDGYEHIKVRGAGNQSLNRSFLIKLLDFKNQALEKFNLYQR